MFDNNLDISIISEDVMAEYIYDSLTVRGLAATESEVEMLAEIFFDFLVDVGVIEEIEIDELNGYENHEED